MTWCLPARADLPALERVVDERRGPDGIAAHAEVAAAFGFTSWAAICAEIERRGVLDACDLETARVRVDADPGWATDDLRGWCDHRGGVSPLSYMAMLRFDAPRLGLTGPIDGTAAMARLLLDAGSPVDGAPGADETPLITAASYGDAGVARVLIAAGADLDALASPRSGGVPGGSALLHAAVFGMTEVLDVLVGAGATVRSLVEAAAAGDLAGWSTGAAAEEERLLALIMAADHERLDVIDELLAAGTPIDAVDREWQRQALRVAAEHGRPASTRHLLARGADPALTDHEGRSALDLCQGEHRYLPGPGHDEVAALLRAAGGGHA